MKKFVAVCVSVFFALNAAVVFGSQGEDRSDNAFSGENCGGGCQVSRPDLSPIEVILDDGTVCTVILPVGIEFEDCLQSNAPGLDRWICDISTLAQVECPE